MSVKLRKSKYVIRREDDWYGRLGLEGDGRLYPYVLIGFVVRGCVRGWVYDRLW